MPASLNSFMGTDWLVLGGFFIALIVWVKFFHNNPFKGHLISRWKGLKKKDDHQVLLEEAHQVMAEGHWGLAEEKFRFLVSLRPDDLEPHLGLAESLFDESVKGVKKYPAKQAEALIHYRWVLDHLLQTGKTKEALALYQKLIGPYRPEDIGERFGSLVLTDARPPGDVPAAPQDVPKGKGNKLHTDFGSFEGAGNYAQAKVVLDEILLREDIHGLTPAFLSRAGEVCLRVQAIGNAERLFEEVARRGDVNQTVRALEILARYWLKNRKQADLLLLYKESQYRFPTIDVFPEWVELGEKLKS